MSLFADCLRSINLEAKLQSRIITYSLRTENVPHLMLWAGTSSSITNLPTPTRKTSPPAGCTVSLPPVFQEYPINAGRGSFGCHGWPILPWGKTGKFQGRRHCSTVGALTGERWITGNHHNQQRRVIIPQSAGQGKMTLKYAQMAFYLPSRDTPPQQQWAWLRSSGFTSLWNGIKMRQNTPI